MELVADRGDIQIGSWPKRQPGADRFIPPYEYYWLLISSPNFIIPVPTGTADLDLKDFLYEPSSRKAEPNKGLSGNPRASRFSCLIRTVVRQN